MESFNGVRFENEEIELDGKQFVDCHFERCKFTFHGGEMPQMKGCFVNFPIWNIDGVAANTLNFVSWLYVQSGGKEMVDPMIDMIRRGERF